MPSISRLNDFQAGNVILSSQVDDEFNQLVNTVNTLPDKDGSLQTNLNADMLDGKHMSVNGGTDKIPLCDSTTIQVALNADLLDGQHASDIAAAAFDVGTKIAGFYQSLPPSGWSEVTKPTDHVLGWKTGQAGGTTVAGSWTVGGLTVVIANHVLTIAEIASHTHSLGNHTHGAGTLTVVTYNSATVNTNEGSGPAIQLREVLTGSANLPVTGNSAAAIGNTSSTGGDTGHNHTGTVSQNGTWRPPTSYIIVCSKD